jgi:hypothetical protein
MEEKGRQDRRGRGEGKEEKRKEERAEGYELVAAQLPCL